MTSTVLILGARGRLGSAAARAFLAAGWEVLGQIRPGTQGLVPGVRWLPLEPHDTLALAQAARGASVVLHALNPPYSQWQTQVPRHMDAAIAVATQLQALLMFPGNVYNFGASMPALLDESTAQKPSTNKGQLRCAVEHQLNTSALRTVIIRAGDFFGSGRGSWFDLALVKDIQKGRARLPGVLDVPTPWAYVPDLAATFVAVAERLQVDPQSLPQHSCFGFAGQQLSGRDWIKLLEPLAREQHWVGPEEALKVAFMPWRLMRALSFAVPFFRELTEMRYLSLTPHALSGAKLEAFLGRVPQTPLPVAIRAALKDLGK